jgi:hypothetical protein
MNRVMERSEENNVLGLAALNRNAVAMADAVPHADYDQASLHCGLACSHGGERGADEQRVWMKIAKFPQGA